MRKEEEEGRCQSPGRSLRVESCSPVQGRADPRRTQEAEESERREEEKEYKAKESRFQVPQRSPRASFLKNRYCLLQCVEDVLVEETDPKERRNSAPAPASIRLDPVRPSSILPLTPEAPPVPARRPPHPTTSPLQATSSPP